MLLHDPEGRVPNVGPVQGGVRILAGTLLVPVMLFAARTVPIDWAFTLIIHGLATAAYLLMTGVGRFDPFFGALASMWTRRVRARGDRPVAARPVRPGRPS